MIFSDYFLITCLVVCLLLATLAGFVIVNTVRYQQRYRRHQREQQALKAAFAQELLESQLEIQTAILEHISQDLHDHVGQLLSVVRLGLFSLRNKTTDTALKQEVNEVNALLQEAVQAVRDVTKTLNPGVIESFGLYESAVFEANRIRKVSQLELQVSLEGSPYALPERQDLLLFRMIQEILNNALKHAQASQISLHFSYESHALRIHITDNGCGFSAQPAPSVAGSGLGLKNLHRRVELLKGALHIDSQPQRGTSVTIAVPTLG